MTKSEIVKEISAKTGIDSKAVLAVVEGFMNEVKTRTETKDGKYSISYKKVFRDY